MKILRYVAFALGGFAALLVAAGLFIYATFDAARLKSELTQIVRDKKQRDLAIDGEIELSFWPPVGARLGRTRLSERGSQAEFAALESARVSLSVLPLLAKRVVIDRLELGGVAATLVRGKDGRLNIDDLLAREEQPDSPILRFDISSIDFRNSRLTYRDESGGLAATLSALNLSTGRIANVAQGRLQLAGKLALDKPAIAGDMTLISDYSIDLDNRRHSLAAAELRLGGDPARLNKLDLSLTAGRIGFDPAAARIGAEQLRITAKGMVDADIVDARLETPKLNAGAGKLEGETVTAIGRITGAQRAIEARLDLNGMLGSAKTFQVAKLALGFDAKTGGMAAKGAVDSPLTVDLQTLLVEMPGFALDIDAKAGASQLKGRLASPLKASLQAGSVDLPKLAGELALASPQLQTKNLHLRLDGELSADFGRQSAAGRLAARFDETTLRAKLSAARFAPLALGFDIDVDRINVDKYIAPGSPDAQKPAADRPIDLSALKRLNATGSLRIGMLQASGIKASNVKLEIKAADGRLDLAPHSASLFEGTLAGRFSADADGNRIVATETLTNVSINPLLRELAQQDLLEGRGTVALDIATGGASVAEMKRALTGSARIAVRDGAVKGVDIAKMLREYKTVAGIQPAPPRGASATEKTDFAEITASFRIADGVARSADFSARSPLLRLAGAGDIDIAGRRIDYLAKATVERVAAGQDGKGIASLKGVSVPLRLTGAFDSLAYQVDYAAIAGDPVEVNVARTVQRQAPQKVPQTALEKTPSRVQDEPKDLARR